MLGNYALKCLISKVQGVHYSGDGCSCILKLQRSILHSQTQQFFTHNYKLFKIKSNVIHIKNTIKRRIRILGHEKSIFYIIYFICLRLIMNNPSVRADFSNYFPDSTTIMTNTSLLHCQTDAFVT